VLDAKLLTNTLNCAGAYSHLNIAQWLRQYGAEWPAVLSYSSALFEDDQADIHQWSGGTLAWARANGCTSPLAL
jgi:hypothetical protein